MLSLDFYTHTRYGSSLRICTPAEKGNPLIKVRQTPPQHISDGACVFAPEAPFLFCVFSVRSDQERSAIISGGGDRSNLFGSGSIFGYHAPDVRENRDADSQESQNNLLEVIFEIILPYFVTFTQNFFMKSFERIYKR